MNAEFLARRFREIRKELGLSAHKVREASRIDVYEIETPRKFGPTFLTVARLAKFYGVSLDRIVQQ